MMAERELEKGFETDPSCHLSDGDADMLLDTLRSVDVRLSIPQNVRELRRFERSFIGGGM